MLFPPFETFPKIPRYKGSLWVASEKIDGTNAQIYITDDGADIFAGSRNKWVTPDDDNYGFARWCYEHKDELIKLGPGHHYGEWWGAGIQRRYGVSDKRFSLFNHGRWSNPESGRPECCSVVPVVAQGTDPEDVIAEAMGKLEREGSMAAPGFMTPEGIVLFHTVSRNLYKVTFDGPKWKEVMKDG